MKITYIKHATAVIEAGGKKMITDPWIVGNFWPFPARPRRITPEELADLDLILISHQHGDHLHPDSLALLPRGARVIVRRGLERKVEKLGFPDVVGLKVWEEHPLGDLRVTAVPARHPGRALGYVITGERTLYFAGDTVFFPGLKEIAARFELDVALLPIGGVKMFGVELGLNPNGAVKAAEILKPKLLIPIHYATVPSIPLVFSMKGSPERLVNTAGPEWREKIRVLEEGQAIEI